MARVKGLRLTIDGVNHWFSKDNHVLFNINLHIKAGEFVSLVGPTGCGKSTLFNAIAGTQLPRAGEIATYLHGDKSIVSSPFSLHGSDRGVVYQEYSLMPFLTAIDNVALGPMLAYTSTPFRCFRPFAWRKKRKENLKQAAELLNKLGLERAFNLYPDEMSGGMKQRVAIAQALIMKPRVLLMDEPFGALDESRREEVQKMFLDLYAINEDVRKTGEDPPYTVIIVTHELHEALYVGSRVVGLSPYWTWKKDHKEYPGATIVYDQPAPLFSLKYGHEFESFEAQKKEIRRIVFDETTMAEPIKFVPFEADYTNGR